MHAQPRPPASAPPIVLLVEDDADTREMYHTALEFDGYRVVDESAATNAVIRAAELKPDIIVTDIGLVGPLDGLSLAHRLRADARTAEIPLLAVTGRDPRSFGDDSALFEEVLLKPVLPDCLSQKIKETLERLRALRGELKATRGRLPALLEQSRQLLDHSRQLAERSKRAIQRVCECPKCGTSLVWTDRRTVGGVRFDHYRPCENGCGVFRYNRRERRVVPLVDE